MKVITFQVPDTFSAMANVEQFTDAVQSELDAETTPNVGGKFTVRVADVHVARVKSEARKYYFQVVSES